MKVTKHNAPKPITPPPTFTIELTESEAQALYVATGKELWDATHMYTQLFIAFKTVLSR